MNAKSVLPD